MLGMLSVELDVFDEWSMSIIQPAKTLKCRWGPTTSVRRRSLNTKVPKGLLNGVAPFYRDRSMGRDAIVNDDVAPRSCRECLEGVNSSESFCFICAEKFVLRGYG